MLPQINWTEWFNNHPNNRDGNKKVSFQQHPQSWVFPRRKASIFGGRNQYSYILSANANNKIMILQSPENFGGTRSRPDNKVVCMLGLGAHATYILIDLRTALTDQ